MNKIFLFSIILIADVTLYGQNNKVDSLIQNINNDQLYGTCHYAWVLEMESDAGISLIKMGNSIVYKIVPLLDNKDKGIIAHYILCNIIGQPVYSSSSFAHYESDSTIDYNYGGLRFHEKDGHFFTSDSLLQENKINWIKSTKNNPFIIYYDSIPLKIK
jgi:hypothetical protein